MTVDKISSILVCIQWIYPILILGRIWTVLHPYCDALSRNAIECALCPITLYSISNPQSAPIKKKDLVCKRLLFNLEILLSKVTRQLSLLTSPSACSVLCHSRSPLKSCRPLENTVLGEQCCVRIELAEVNCFFFCWPKYSEQTSGIADDDRIQSYIYCVHRNGSSSSSKH